MNMRRRQLERDMLTWKTCRMDNNTRGLFLKEACIPWYAMSHKEYYFNRWSQIPHYSTDTDLEDVLQVI